MIAAREEVTVFEESLY